MREHAYSLSAVISGDQQAAPNLLVCESRDELVKQKSFAETAGLSIDNVRLYFVNVSPHT